MRREGAVQGSAAAYRLEVVQDRRQVLRSVRCRNEAIKRANYRLAVCCLLTCGPAARASVARRAQGGAVPTPSCADPWQGKDVRVHRMFQPQGDGFSVGISLHASPCSQVPTFWLTWCSRLIVIFQSLEPICQHNFQTSTKAMKELSVHSSTPEAIGLVRQDCVGLMHETCHS